MQIAPRLQALSRIDSSHSRKNDWKLADDWKGQRRELKALLAVARAADRVIATTFPPADWKDKAWSLMDRALARLERVSKTP